MRRQQRWDHFCCSRVDLVYDEYESEAAAFYGQPAAKLLQTAASAQLSRWIATVSWSTRCLPTSTITEMERERALALTNGCSSPISSLGAVEQGLPADGLLVSASVLRGTSVLW